MIFLWPELDYNLNFTFNKAQKREVRAALSNTFGFGGHNCCVVFKKYAEYVNALVPVTSSLDFPAVRRNRASTLPALLRSSHYIIKGAYFPYAPSCFILYSVFPVINGRLQVPYEWIFP